MHNTQAPRSTESQFEIELIQLINKHSLENRAHCPDYLLAMYLRQCYEMYCDINLANMMWHGWDKQEISKQKTTV